MAARPFSIALLFSACVVLAANPSVREVTGEIDTTFGEDPAPIAPLTQTPDPIRTARPNQNASTTAASDVSTAPEDEPFDNVLDPEFTTERHWSLDASSSYAGTAWDTTTLTHSIGLSRSFSAASVTFTPRVSWNRQSSRPDPEVANWYTAGTYASWQPFDEFGLGLDGEWVFQPDADDWSTTADVSSDHEFTETFAISAGAWGGWSKSARALLGASLGATLSPGDLSISAQGNWNYRMEQLINKARYLNVWGWSTSARWTRGRWSMGPSWSGEYWSATANVPKNASTIKAKSKASGDQLSQSVGWSTSWKPISAIRFDLGLVKNFGTSDVSVTRTNLKFKNTAKRIATEVLMPENSLGATFGFGFDW